MSDPHYNSVISLLPFEPILGDGFFDRSPLSLVYTKFGNPIISATDPKYGARCLLLDGSSRLELSNSAFALGLEDFTIELWAKPSYLPSWACLLAFGNHYENSLYLNSGVIRWYTSGANGTSSTLVTGVWRHIALTRQGTTFRVFLDGVLQSTFTLNQSIPLDRLVIGANGRDGERYSGFMDDLRITRGVCRYTENFTPAQIVLPPLMNISGLVSGIDLPTTVAVLNSNLDVVAKINVTGSGEYSVELPPNSYSILCKSTDVSKNSKVFDVSA